MQFPTKSSTLIPSRGSASSGQISQNSNPSNKNSEPDCIFTILSELIFENSSLGPLLESFLTNFEGNLLAEWLDMFMIGCFRILKSCPSMETQKLDLVDEF